MADSDLELENDETVSQNHSKLLNTVTALDLKQRIKKAVINDPTLEVSEFHLGKNGISDKTIINVNNLARTLGKTAAQNDIKQQVLKLRSKAKTLQKPLEKPVADRIKRSVGYEKTKEELKRWNGIVARNRTIGHISFPLCTPSMKMDPQYEMKSRCSIKSELEKEFEKLEKPKEVEIVDKQEEQYKLTKEELLEKRKEAARLRIQESYKAAKARRQNKIKSKKFHRIQRKQKLKAEIKEFEELQKTDPEAALEKLQLLDKVRAKERISLRHKNTGQWAKNLQVRAKYDKESRQALAQQLAISRELTQKLKKADDSDEDDEKDNPPPPPCITADDKDNPWMNSVKTSEEIDQFLSSYRKFWEQKNQQVGSKDNENSEAEKEKVKESKVKILAAMNPVEEVIVMENENENEIERSKDQKKKKQKKVEKEKTIIKEKSKNKKLSKSKSDKKVVEVTKKLKCKEKSADKQKKKQIFGTSDWAVESNEDSNESAEKSNNFEEELDDLFDNVDKKLKKDADLKLKLMKEQMQNNSNLSNKTNAKKRKRKSTKPETDLEKLALKGDKVKPILDEPMLESVNDRFISANPVNESNVVNSVANAASCVSTRNSKDQEINVDSFIEVKPQFIKSQMPDSNMAEALDDSDDDENEKQSQMISEAFADDDAVKDFKKEKLEEIKKGQTKDLDLTLPGWGSWGGKNIKIPQRKRKKFLIKMPKADKRKDENKGNVIIIEEKDAKIREHLVNEVPFPFKSVADFEASLRAPIGRDFVPERLHSKLIVPAVTTKAGKIIEPMDEEVLVKKPNKRRRLLN